MATKKSVDETTLDEVATAETTAKTVKVRLPRKEGHNASQQEFYSLNFKNYIIKRGVEVEVPEELAEVILNGERAEEAAIQYAEEKKLKEA